ncbi:hypothetical protein ACQ4PT_060509 [Festuca glaucescens]
MSRTSLAGSRNVGLDVTAHELYEVRLGRRRDPNQKAFKYSPPHRLTAAAIPTGTTTSLSHFRLASFSSKPSTRNPSRPVVLSLQHMADIVSIYVFISQSLTGIKGLSEAKVDKICEAAEKLLSQGFMTGSDLLIKMCLRLFDLLLLILKRKSVVRITTGSQALDELLGGGIETLCITEAFGEFRSGKTQLAHTLCVSTQLPLHMHGGNGKVAYIDTEGTFRPERIVPIAERFGMDANAVLDNIIYARAYTYEHQYNLLLGLAAKMAEEPFRLLIVDSVIALFRVDFSGRGELAERQQKLAQMLSRLTKIAEEFNVAVYITNQVIADPGGGMFITDPKKPAGGHVLAHAATIRLMLRKGKGEQRVCKIFDAPNLPEGEAISFYSKHITTGGLMDVKD